MKKVPKFIELEKLATEKGYHLLVGCRNNKWSVEIGLDKFRYEAAECDTLKEACDIILSLMA